MTTNAEVERQAAYHAELFANLSRWDEVWEAAIDVVGDPESAVELGLDQMGLFGPRGVSLVMERLFANTTGKSLSCIVELGCGFGGALRHAGRILRSRGLHAQMIGVEMVPWHCEVARNIGRALGDETAVIVEGDAGCLPLSSASTDAAFAAGSASYFSSIRDVTSECHRVLRSDGVLVMIDEVSLQPHGTPPLSEVFLTDHRYLHLTTPEERRSQMETAGFEIVEFESLAAWGEALLQQRAQALRFLGACAQRVYGADASHRIISALTSAAHEYARGTIQPTLIVARRLSD
jgi:ubiquinone/menaquinone biosynthesis C-methylase UbiE